ncbi:MAG: glyoxalase/bleomycin resistance/dioxygenase family protein [Pseudomonadales bacterium]|nr:glyoxalase/bleomycin resistance/dioxygenase family protein [Pseudomonadales bacterium]
MKRLHLHVSVTDLDQAITFYNTLFATDAAVIKSDYAKWMLDDPAINFAISNRGHPPGLNHLGFQVDSDEQLGEISSRLQSAGFGGNPEQDAKCCYAHSNKYWTKDPADIPWESFHTLGEIPTYYNDQPKPQSGDTGERCCN